MITKEYAGKTIAYGLSWHRMPGEKASAEIAALCAELGMPYGIHRIISSEGVDAQVAHQLGLCADKSGLTAYSAAAMLAKGEKNLLLVEELQDDTFWVCAIAGHEVLAGGDAIVKNDDLHDTFQDLGSMFDSIDGLKISVPVSAMQYLGDDYDCHQGFEDIILSNNIAPSSEHKIKHLKGIPRSVFLMGGFLLAAGAAYVAISQTSPPDFTEVIEKRAPVVNLVEQDKKTLKSIILEQPNEDVIFAQAELEEIEWIREDLTSNAAALRLGSLIEILNETPLASGGWVPQAVSWSNVSSADIAVIDWQNDGVGTVNTLLNDIQNGSASFSSDGISAAFSRSLGSSFLPVEDIENALTNKSFSRLEMLNRLQQYKFSASISPSPLGTRKVPIMGIADEVRAQQWRYRHHKSKWSVSGAGSDRLKHLAAIFIGAKNITLSTLTFTFDKEHNWSVSGEIYEK